jgi:hypothetical protein
LDPIDATIKLEKGRRIFTKEGTLNGRVESNVRK